MTSIGLSCKDNSIMYEEIRIEKLKNVKVALICVTYNSGHLYKTLLSIYRSKNHADWHLFLFDNKPDEHGQLYAKSNKLYNTVLIPSEKNVFWAGGLNHCLQLILERDYDYVFFLNDDIEVGNNWIDNMVGVLQSDEQIGAVGPLNSCERDWQYINNVAERFKTVPRFDNLNLNLINNKLAELNKNYMVMSGMLAFFAVCFPIEVFNKVGLIDEDFDMGGDDDDFCFRLQHYRHPDPGYKLALDLKTYVIHHGGVSTQQMNDESLEKFKLRKQRNIDLLKQKRYQLLNNHVSKFR